jgi:hypothetical protein
MIEKLDPNSLLFWFPKIKDLKIPQPKTAIWEIPDEFMKHLRSENVPDLFVEEAAKHNPFGYPVFLRTDQASAKHEWERGAFVCSRNMLQTCIFETISHNLCAGLFGLPFRALVFREYVPMQSSYKAFRGMPVNPERRYFVKDGKVICHHVYWVKSAIRAYGSTKLPENWKELSAAMNHESENETKLLTGYAEDVSRVVEGHWSVDFCKAADGCWYLIDMAQTGSSWHPDDCPHYVKPEVI